MFQNLKSTVRVAEFSFFISLILLSVVVVWFILKPVEPLQLETRGVPSPVAIVVCVVVP